MKKLAGVLIAAATFTWAASPEISASGTIRGVVRNPSGAVIPGAVVKVFHRGELEAVSTSRAGCRNHGN